MIPSPRTILIEFKCRDCNFETLSLTTAMLHIMDGLLQRDRASHHGMVSTNLPPLHTIEPIATIPPGFKLMESRRKFTNDPANQGETDAPHT